MSVDKTCPTCGVGYCLPQAFDDARREDHKTWYCPNGHPLHYPTESPKERRIRLLEESVAWERQCVSSRIASLEREVRSLRSRLAWARRRARAVA